MQLSNAEKTIFGRLVQQFYRFDKGRESAGDQQIVYQMI
jgi:hypothetical protein